MKRETENKIIEAVFNAMAYIALFLIILPGALIMLLMRRVKRKK